MIAKANKRMAMNASEARQSLVTGLSKRMPAMKRFIPKGGVDPPICRLMRKMMPRCTCRPHFLTHTVTLKLLSKPFKCGRILICCNQREDSCLLERTFASLDVEKILILLTAGLKEPPMTGEMDIIADLIGPRCRRRVTE